MAIENSIGPQAGNFFKKVEKIICKIPTSFMGLEWDKLKTQLEKHTRESKARDRKFLGDLASDKFYLEDVLDKLGEHLFFLYYFVRLISQKKINLGNFSMKSISRKKMFREVYYFIHTMTHEKKILEIEY